MNQEDLQKLKDTNSCPTGDFEGANLSGMDLRRANLSGAALKKANLSNADMTEANLSVADLTGAKLENAKRNRIFIETIVHINNYQLIMKLRSIPFNNTLFSNN